MNNIAPSAADWAARITSHWRESVNAIFEVGRLLQQSKDHLGAKAWGEMCSDMLPFSGNTAYRLIAISNDPRLLAHGQKLPPHWRTNYELTKLTDEQFEDAIEDGTINPEMERGDVSGRVKAQKRAEKERKLGGLQLALPEKKFGVIVADPPWAFEPYSRETGMDRAADNHYPTSDVERIAQSHPVESIAADDCVLFLWATVPMLSDAMWLINRWGFAYKSHCIWAKDRVGTGYWFRNAHELLLVGTKGNIPAPAPGTQYPSLIEGRVTKHSTKPEVFLEMIETLFPTLPKIELNRRGPARPGWTAWGNELEDSGADVAARYPASDEPARASSPESPPARAGSPLPEDETNIPW
jgi:N6-adenosine-specific RNA methylase IME4